ncbi:uncharacterized protein KY384_003291 [Bacidia gigantensis]|uniref:uncharacterized protein n=1 Tax=Bacidia gigantensis TaxID=2732470 RepID=UPI001D0473F5|nr:uncharacterized protein KY384_003291 [Bacidia gigantensis]KAG8531660.1 hypothetical protein KY384_003291 [Bacidia gigantensis]
MGVTFSQFFPPPPTLTEANLPIQRGKVFVVTGGYSGVGLELCTMLFQAGGSVYIAGRSEAKAESAMSQIKSLHPDSSGQLHFLPLSLDDLTTIKPAVDHFTSKESRLHVLFNNAGVSLPPKESTSKQGHELSMATNCLGPYLLTQLFLPILLQTAKMPSSASVRVVWTSSIVVDLSAPRSGLHISELTNLPSNQQRNYLNSKTGNWFLADALAAQVADQGVLSFNAESGKFKNRTPETCAMDPRLSLESAIVSSEDGRVH